MKNKVFNHSFRYRER